MRREKTECRRGAETQVCSYTNFGKYTVYGTGERSRCRSRQHTLVTQVRGHDAGHMSTYIIYIRGHGTGRQLWYDTPRYMPEVTVQVRGYHTGQMSHADPHAETTKVRVRITSDLLVFLFLEGSVPPRHVGSPTTSWPQYNRPHPGHITVDHILITLQLTTSWPHHSWSHPDHTTTDHILTTLQLTTSWPHYNWPHPDHATTDHILTTLQLTTSWPHYNWPHPDHATTDHILAIVQPTTSWPR